MRPRPNVVQKCGNAPKDEVPAVTFAAALLTSSFGNAPWHSTVTIGGAPPSGIMKLPPFSLIPPLPLGPPLPLAPPLALPAVSGPAPLVDGAPALGLAPALPSEGLVWLQAPTTDPRGMIRKPSV